MIRASGRWRLVEAACPDELTRTMLEHLRASWPCGGAGRTALVNDPSIHPAVVAAAVGGAVVASGASN